MARSAVVAFLCLGGLGFVTLPGCTSLPVAQMKQQIEGDVLLMKATFAATAFCPSERVLTRPAPQLAFEVLGSSVSPWQEPIPPHEVAEDPARMRIWMSKRDADYATWARAVEAAKPRLSPEPIYEVSGCGAMRLYACGDDGLFHRHAPQRACHEAGKTSISLSSHHDNRRVACRNGGILHAQPARADEPFSSCTPLLGADAQPNGAEPIGIAASENLSRAEAACESTCAATEPCRSDCTTKHPSEPVLCSVDCAADAGRCRLGCATTARRVCEARGLDALGICGELAELEARDQSAESKLTANQTETHQTAEVDARNREEWDTLADCRKACDEPSMPCRDSVKVCGKRRVGCLLKCSRSSRERCESFTPTLSDEYCHGFKIWEDVDARMLTR